MGLIKVFIVMFCILQYNSSVGRLSKMIYERDLSEHCRRRVVPSVFLGRKVVEANSRILQFSRLELPYSCFITVRCESGNSMVMMLQVMSKEVQSSCQVNEQLLVYEMGETFGGYWGPLPDSVLKREPLPPRVYTLKNTRPVTTLPTLTEEESDSEEEEPVTLPPSTTSASLDQPSGDYIEVMVPLVNLSVHMEPGGGGGTGPAVQDDDQDLQDDVTPIPGVKYTTEILPLVQLQMVQDSRRGGDGGEDTVPRYDVQIGIDDFTPDLRLTLPPLISTKRRHKQRQRYTTTRRVDFKKHRTLFHSQVQNRRTMSQATNRMHITTKYSFPTKIKSTEGLKRTKSTQTQDSWNIIADILKKLSKRPENSTKTLSLMDATLLDEISGRDHNKSVYLSANLSMYENNDDFKTHENITTISYNNVTSISWDPVILMLNTTEQTKSTDTINEEEPTESLAFIQTVISPKEIINDTTENKLMDITTLGQISKAFVGNISTDLFNGASDSSSEMISENLTEIITSRLVTESQTIHVAESETFSMPSTENPIQSSRKSLNLNEVTPGYLVGHESWENVVQAAPVMAVLLNKTVDTSLTKASSIGVPNHTEVSEATRKTLLKKRKKRDIHSIAIENARPHRLTTRKVVATTTKLTFNAGHMQEFAQLAEMQDDEMHGRVALRYLHQYVGPPLFNLCDITDSTKPNVFLFNSSRIVISLTNFTLERMVIVLTAARALRSTEVKCPRTRLECQVSGARVCMDALVACDGVPNCGSYDIYDEDRLLCGHTDSLQQNVYLAAFTFLAVLLTLVYAVHYWLKRCVPKVADAFFVYSDGVENILYLESVMRSPHDTDDPKTGFQSHMFGDDILYDDVNMPQRMSCCQRFLRAICCCCYRAAHRKPPERKHSIMPAMPKKMYSFTELEIRKMLTSYRDTGIQTGESLLMNRQQELYMTSSPPILRPTAQSYDFTATLDNIAKKKDSLLTLEEPFPEEYKDELSLIKFFKESRSDVIAAAKAANQQKPENKTFKSVDVSVGSASERELGIYSYDGRMSEPGPSRIRNIEQERDDRVNEKIPVNKEKSQAEKERTHREKEEPPIGKDKAPLEKEKSSPPSSISKHLRFDEVPITIPPAYDNDDVPKHSEGRRGIFAMDRNRRVSRHLDAIEEGDEQPGGSRDHRHFWRTNKGKKAKKGQVLR